MDFVITFFKDILDGPVYTVLVAICSVLFCACIGYLAEKKEKKRLEKEQYVEVKNTTTATGSPSLSKVDSTVVSTVDVKGNQEVVPSTIPSVTVQPTAPPTSITPAVATVPTPNPTPIPTVPVNPSSLGPTSISKDVPTSVKQS